MTLVIAWPPVGATSAEWTVEAPVERSRSLITGARYVSASRRRRRLASLTVSSRALGGMGAGYMEALKLYLDGGVNLVRLTSLPINRRVADAARGGALTSERLTWTAGGDPLAWSAGDAPLPWWQGRLLRGVVSVSGGFTTVAVSGLPPSRQVILPGDFLTVFADLDADEGQLAQAVKPATSDAAGVAHVRVFQTLAPTSEARVNLGVQASGVFEALEIPRSAQPARGDWTWSWSFREVFKDETDGFEWLYPWS